MTPDLMVGYIAGLGTGLLIGHLCFRRRPIRPRDPDAAPGQTIELVIDDGRLVEFAAEGTRIDGTPWTRRTRPPADAA